MSTPRLPLHTVWDSLLAALTLGTDRQPFTPPEGLPVGDPDDPARTALDSVAAVLQYRRAGVVPTQNPHPLPVPAPLDDFPLPPPEIGAILGNFIANKQDQFFAEYLTLLNVRGYRVPEEYLPSLLQHGGTMRGLQGYALPVLGKRGHWLAARNKFWSWGAEQSAPGTLGYALHGDERPLMEVFNTTRIATPAEATTIAEMLENFTQFWSIELTDAVLNSGTSLILTLIRTVQHRIMYFGAIELAADIHKWLVKNAAAYRAHAPDGMALLEPRLRLYRAFGMDGLPPRP